MSRPTMRSLLLLLTLPLAGCIAVEGPMGPPGLDGESYRLMVTENADVDGDASVTLPTYVGTDLTQPPAVTCYESESAASGQWLVVGDGFSETSSYCAVTFVGGRWVVSMHAMQPGWTAAWVIMY
jgi:hypothetical protein